MKIQILEPLHFSIIIAIYKREEELKELLNSLTQQTDSAFEVLVIDDGSPTPLSAVVDSFKNKLDIKYYFKENSGPALTRNFGMKRAHGNYFIFLDSDTIVPENYIEIIRSRLYENYTDAFGGPDDSSKNFSSLQKAISFSMTSVLTTGGIRGRKKSVTKFQPRSFNMGISKKAFEKTNGFGELRIGEDPDLSMTLWENGFETQLIYEAKVYHKRRSSLKKFFRQVYNFGVARPILNQRHPKYKSLTFWFPSLFSLGMIISFLFLIVLQLPLFTQIKKFKHILIGLGYALSLFYAIYFAAILIVSSIQNKSLKVGLLSLVTTFIQFTAYGFGFLKSWILLNILGWNPKKAFPSHFSK